jgi:hypothetical protein
VSSFSLFRIGVPLVLAAVLTGCHPQGSAIQTVGGPIKELSAKQLVKHLESRRLDYAWLGAKTHAEVALPGNQKLGFTLNIRVRRDSMIWLQFMKVGIEGARARITPQGGLELLNRQEKTYTVLSFDDLERQYGIALSYAELQDLLAGLPSGYGNRRFRSAVADDLHLLSSNDGGEGLQFYLEDGTFHLRRYVRESRAGKLDLLLGEYAQPSGRSFAQSRTATIVGRDGQRMLLDVVFNEVVFDVPQRIAFDVPEKYTRQ